MKYRRITFLSATAFLVLRGAILFLVAGTLALPSIWVYLVLRLLFTAASVVAMSDEVARARLKPGAGAKPEALYITGTAIAWAAHIILVPLDLGRFGWSRGFPIWLQGMGGLSCCPAFHWLSGRWSTMSTCRRASASRGITTSMSSRPDRTRSSAIPTTPGHSSTASRADLSLAHGSPSCQCSCTWRCGCTALFRKKKCWPASCRATQTTPAACAGAFYREFGEASPSATASAKVE